MRPYIALAFMMFGVAPCGAFAKNASLLSLGMEHFRDTATVTDDPARGLTTISTERGFVRSSGPMGTVWNDEFLTAVIDDKTGRKSFQIEVSTTYNGARRAYPSADLGGMGGPSTGVATLVKTETANCATGECMYSDRLEIPIEEGLLRRLAAGYVPGKPVVLSYKLTAKRGVGYQGELSNAEIAGLLARVDGYAAEPPPPKAEAPTPRRLDFGISGIVVSPSAEMPNRAGVLVAAVNGASVAQQAGIITGDIIYQIDDRPTRSLADLEAAVAESAPHATATIRIFRGVKEMALKARY